MPLAVEPKDAIYEYLRVLCYAEDAFSEVLWSLSRAIKRGDTGVDEFIDGALSLGSIEDGAIAVTPSAFAGFLEASSAEKMDPLRTAVIIFTADEAIKSLTECLTGSKWISAGEEIEGFSVSDYIRAVANSHRHYREWHNLALRADENDASALRTLSNNKNQPVLKGLCRTTQWVIEPCGLWLIELLCGKESQDREFNIERLMERLRSVARDVCVKAFGGVDAFDDAMMIIADEETYSSLDIHPII